MQSFGLRQGLIIFLIYNVQIIDQEFQVAITSHHLRVVINTWDISFHRSSTMEINHEEWLSSVLAGVKSTIMTKFGEADGKITALEDVVARERGTSCAANLQVVELRKKLEEDKKDTVDKKVTIDVVRV